MSDNANYITVNLETYEALICNDQLLTALIDAIKLSARLYTTEDHIFFDSESLNSLLRVLLPETYEQLLTKLKADKEMDKEF